MKRKIKFCLLFMLFLSGTTIFVTAQETEKSKLNYLPEEGNFAIGVDATPIFDYLGNIFNNTVGNSLNLFQPAIYGKYYLTDMSAIRAIVSIGNSSDKYRFYSRDDAAWAVDPLSNAQVIDFERQTNNVGLISGAYQQFIGEKRLRGFYGGQFFYGWNHSRSNYSYGNPMTTLNPMPSSAYPYVGGARTLKNVSARTNILGIGGIAGFEYFVIPQLCVGGEVSLNAVFSREGQLYRQSEKVESGKVVINDVAIFPGDRSFSFQTVSFGPGFGNHIGFYVMFHF